MPLALLSRRILAPRARAPEHIQFGAIPYQVIDGHAVFLMITSRSSANWIFPKGSALAGLAPWQVAEKEALEEAGVRGEIAETPVGYYERMHEGKGLMRVDLFPLQVTEQFDTWQEEPERFRHWALLPQVHRLMASKQAARVAASFARDLLR